MTDTPAQDLAAADNPTPLRWGLGDILHGDDDTTTVLLSGPHGEPYWLELAPDRAAALHEDLANPYGEEPAESGDTAAVPAAVAVFATLVRQRADHIEAAHARMRDRLEVTQARVRRLHAPDENGECQHCHHSSPCPTVQVLEDEADAVLGVLPAEVDTVAIRAAELDDTASLLQVGGNADGAALLRRRAALLREVGKPRPVVPRRGDTVEQWLKAQRDASAYYPQVYQAADGLLDLYRLHADTRTPLAEHLCEARTVGDCDCLEQPAAASALGQPGEEARP